MKRLLRSRPTCRFVSLSLRLSVSLFLHLCLSVCPSVSLPPSLPPSLPHRPKSNEYLAAVVLSMALINMRIQGGSSVVSSCFLRVICDVFISPKTCKSHWQLCPRRQARLKWKALRQYISISHESVRSKAAECYDLWLPVFSSNRTWMYGIGKMCLLK